eukprot:54353-Pyramimonas_sp.AAC.1
MVGKALRLRRRPPSSSASAGTTAPAASSMALAIASPMRVDRKTGEIGRSTTSSSSRLSSCRIVVVHGAAMPSRLYADGTRKQQGRISGWKEYAIAAPRSSTLYAA